jgi:hypothetical protein
MLAPENGVSVLVLRFFVFKSQSTNAIFCLQVDQSPRFAAAVQSKAKLHRANGPRLADLFPVSYYWSLILYHIDHRYV